MSTSIETSPNTLVSNLKKAINTESKLVASEDVSSLTLHLVNVLDRDDLIREAIKGLKPDQVLRVTDRLSARLPDGLPENTIHIIVSFQASIGK